MATNITRLFRLWYWLYDDVFIFMTSLEYMQPDLNSLEHKQTLQYGFSPGWIISCLFKLERFWTPNLISFHLWRSAWTNISKENILNSILNNSGPQAFEMSVSNFCFCHCYFHFQWLPYPCQLFSDLQNLSWWIHFYKMFWCNMFVHDTL